MKRFRRVLIKSEVIERRGQSLNMTVHLFNDSYNANVASFKAALDACQEKRQIAVVGSIGS